MTVKELFESEKLTKDDVVNVAVLNSYWNSSSDFVLENWDSEIESLSAKQAAWLNRIFDDMTERRIEGGL